MRVGGARVQGLVRFGFLCALAAPAGCGSDFSQTWLGGAAGIASGAGGEGNGGSGGESAGSTGQGGDPQGEGGTGAATGGVAGAAGVAGASGNAAAGGTAGNGASGGGGATAGGGGATAGGGGATAGSGGAGGGPTPSCPLQEPATCESLKQALIHRYSFDGSTAQAVDSIGGAHGTAVNATNQNGVLTLAGGTSDQYVDLPNGIVSALVNASFEIWLTWNGGDPWQQLLDFGNSTGGENVQATGAGYLILVPRTDVQDGSTGGMRMAYTTGDWTTEVRFETPQPLPAGAASHVVAIVDDDGDALRLYVNGALAGQVSFFGALSALSDVNNWIGRSQYSGDPELAATLDEFRIYDRALTATEIAASRTLGPNPAFLE